MSSQPSQPVTGFYRVISQATDMSHMHSHHGHGLTLSNTREDHHMMDRVSVIEITGSADSAYYSHQSFESELSCDLSEANTDTPAALQGEQGES